MIQTSFTTSKQELAGIMVALLDKIFINQLIIGDIHAPMNKLSDIYRLNKGDKIIGGWSIFRGFDLPTIIIPPALPESWQSIRNMIKLLGIEEFQTTFPQNVSNTEDIAPPWDEWNEYESTYLFTDIAMQLVNTEVAVMDISHLPKIRAATIEDGSAITEYFALISNTEGTTSFWNPIQLESGLFVIAEEKDGSIVGIGGSHYETPITVQLGNIHVRKDFRRIGLGRAITVACVLGVLRTNRSPTLFVNEHNKAAIELYESIGFEKYNEFDFHRLKLIQ